VSCQSVAIYYHHWDLHPTGSVSSIDLTLCSPTIAVNYTWSTEDDTYGSDYFPIIISSEQSPFNIRENWKLNKADWANFSSKCQYELTDLLLTSREPIDSFTSTLTNIANLTIPKIPVSRNKPKNHGLMKIVKMLSETANMLYKLFVNTLTNKTYFAYHGPKLVESFVKLRENPGKILYQL